jgi:ribose/xylose/arabinose/galactoside ABC-type transport system permease subunit
VLLFYWIQQPLIFSDFGVVGLFNQSVALAIVAIAQTLVVICGAIDLSIGAIISLTACFAATYMGTSGASTALTILATLVLGIVAGSLNGILVAYGKLEALIATLTTYFVYQGVALIIRPTPGGSVPAWFESALSGSLCYLPASACLLGLCVLMCWLPLMRSRLGREIEAVGNSEQNAYLSGLSPRRAKISAYAFSGLLCSVAGLFLISQTGSGDAALGQVYTLNAIACVVLGGVSLRGGKGSVFGPVLSAFLLSIIVSALLAWGISAFWQNLVQGSILVLVLVGAGLPLLRSRSWARFVRGQIS